MTNASISKVSIEEKISIMEMIWGDLCKHGAVESPDWHHGVLKVHQQKRAVSQEQSMDWAEAKRHILN